LQGCDWQVAHHNSKADFIYLQHLTKLTKTNFEFTTWCHSLGVVKLLVDHYDAVIEDMNESVIPELEIQI